MQHFLQVICGIFHHLRQSLLGVLRPAQASVVRSSRHQDNKTIQEALKNSISSCLLSLCSIPNELWHVNDMLDGLVGWASFKPCWSRIHKNPRVWNYQQHKGPSILASHPGSPPVAWTGRARLGGVNRKRCVLKSQWSTHIHHSPKGRIHVPKFLNLCQGFLGWNDIFCQDKSFVNIIQLVIWKSVLRVGADPPPFFIFEDALCWKWQWSTHRECTHWKQVKGIQSHWSFHHCNWPNSSP